MVGVEGEAEVDDEDELVEKPVHIWPEVLNRFRSEIEEINNDSRVGAG